MAFIFLNDTRLERLFRSVPYVEQNKKYFSCLKNTKDIESISILILCFAYATQQYNIVFNTLHMFLF